MAEAIGQYWSLSASWGYSECQDSTEPEISGRTGLMTSDAWARSRLELHWKRWGAVVVVIVVYSTYTEVRDWLHQKER